MPFAELFRQRLGVDLQELTADLVDQLGLARLGGAGIRLADFAGGERQPGGKSVVAGILTWSTPSAASGCEIIWTHFLAVSQMKSGDTADDMRAGAADAAAI